MLEKQILEDGNKKMTIIKDLILTFLFLCMFVVLLCFLQFHTELRSSAIQNDITINAQTKIIQNNIIGSLEQIHKINCLKIDIIDLREILLILQKKKEISEDEMKEHKSDISKLERGKRRLLSKIERLEREIKDGQKMPM